MHLMSLRRCCNKWRTVWTFHSNPPSALLGLSQNEKTLNILGASKDINQHSIWPSLCSKRMAHRLYIVWLFSLYAFSTQAEELNRSFTELRLQTGKIQRHCQGKYSFPTFDINSDKWRRLLQATKRYFILDRHRWWRIRKAMQSFELVVPWRC